MDAQPVVKTIGSNGQVSLGKQYAGQQVLIEQYEEGVWLIRTAEVIPLNERWLHTSEHRAKLDKALEHATTNPTDSTNTDAILEQLERSCAHE